MLAAVESTDATAEAAAALMSNTALQQLSEHINSKHRAAQYAQRDSQQLFQTLFFSDKADDDDVCVVNAVVFETRCNGVMVFVPRSELAQPTAVKELIITYYTNIPFTCKHNCVSAYVLNSLWAD